MQISMFSDSEMKASPAQNQFLSCEKCGLALGCQSPKMESFGDGQKKILLIGEAPGGTEDRTGRPFVGKTGRFLGDCLEKVGIDMDRDCVRTNANLCRPAGNKTPTDAQIAHCRKFLYQLIEKMKPQKILTFGDPALKGLLGHEVSIGAISKWVGWSIPDQDLGCWVFPNFHPSYAVRSSSGKERNDAVEVWFRRHLKNAIEHSETFYRHNYRSDVHVLRDVGEIVETIERLSKLVVVAFDYETTGLKPYNRGHKIVSVSMSDGIFGYAFMFYDKRVKEAWIQFLQSDVKKIAHNLKFEDRWSKTILGVKVNRWFWDTMNNAHILDNRGGITRLDFQVYVHFGVRDYSSKVSPYLEAKGGNEFNDIEKCPQSMLLQYGGEDSLYTYKLFEVQRDPMQKYKEPARLFFNAALNFSKMEEVGIRADARFFEKQEGEADKRLEDGLQRIRSHEGVPAGFNPDSPKEVVSLLYDTLGLEPPGGVRSADDKVLEKFDLQVCRDLQYYRQWSKIKGTYLAGFRREISEDGYLHCMFNLNTVSTYRSSSSYVNFQNIPVRDEDAKQMTRGGLGPRPGEQLEELDFKGIEVIVSVCYHRDPTMLDYVRDPKTDMHRDQACEIFFRQKEDWQTKDPAQAKLLKFERYQGKNGFVFPEFYGSYYVNCAKEIWAALKPDSLSHLKYEGIRTLDDFTAHLKSVEDRFWRERFPVYAQWKESNWEKYQRRGYIDLFTGFRCQAIMSKNQANNMAIQGTAFHVALETIDYMMGRLDRWKSDVLGEIHDSMLLSVVPDESDDLGYLGSKALTHVMEKWGDWLIVPLTVERQKAPIDAPWTELRDAGKITSTT